jgi:hypothetical protein
VAGGSFWFTNPQTLVGFGALMPNPFGGFFFFFKYFRDLTPKPDDGFGGSTLKLWGKWWNFWGIWGLEVDVG